MKSFKASQNDEGVRLSRFVQNVTKDLPSSLLYKSFRNKRIKINGKAKNADYRLLADDLIELYINDEFFATNKFSATDSVNEITPVAQPKIKQPKLDIVFEDDNIAVIFKPSHLLCHSDKSGDANVVDAFIQYLEQKGEYSREIENRFTPSICNRLDRGTQGLVIAAKNYASLRDMNEIIKYNYVLKQYLCITCSVPPKGRHKAFLRHIEKDNKAIVKTQLSVGYKEIITDIDIENAHPPLALCKIGLITGRTHQIRAHLAFLGAPILGDIKYGSAKMNAKYNIKGQSLCANRLTFYKIPQQNSLNYLSNKNIELKNPDIINLYQTLNNV